jgi:hypothetical protein
MTTEADKPAPGRLVQFRLTDPATAVALTMRT